MSNEAVLNQDEVDALLHGMKAGQVSTEPATPPATTRPYDLGREARRVRGRMAALEMMNERFAKRYRQTLYTLLRRSVSVGVPELQSLRFDEYLQRLHVPSSLHVARFAPLRGTGLVVLPPQLVFSVVDHYFGGSGRPSRNAGREFTTAESRIALRLAEAALADLREAWGTVLPIAPEHVRSEQNPQYISIADPSEVVVLFAFRVELEGTTADLQLVMPYAMLEPVRDRLEGGVPDGAVPPDGRWATSLREEIEDAEVELTTCLGRAQLTLAGLLNLKPGDVIPCDFTGRATVCAEDIPILRGTFGISRGQQAVKVDERVLHARPASTPQRASQPPTRRQSR
jgi:flagellar motor switch protein FliM